VREFAQRVLAANGDLEPLGKKWMTGFLRRNPEIKTMRGKRIDSIRINGASTERIKGFFAILAMPIIKEIPPQDRYNMDETGILEGQGSNGLVLGASHKRHTMKKQPGSRSWTTIIECIAANGVALDPLVIFKGKSVQQQWFPDEISFLQDWHFWASEKGWTNDSIALKWLLEVFIPQTRPSTPQGKRLLIIDGHGSHETDDFLYNCFKHDIYLIFLPPHASHVLQPLDVAVFSSIKTAYRTQLSRLSDITDSAPVNKITFLRCYHYARSVGFLRRNIISGWRATGLWPVAMAKPLLNPMVMDQLKTPITIPTIVTKEEDQLDIIIRTPKHSSQVQRLAQRLLQDHRADPAVRLLFRKIGKSLDDQNNKIAASENIVRGLEARIETLQPKKKRKIEPGPNERFIKIDEIMKAKAAIQAALDPAIAPDLAQQEEFESYCDMWQA